MLYSDFNRWRAVCLANGFTLVQKQGRRRFEFLNQPGTLVGVWDGNLGEGPDPRRTDDPGPAPRLGYRGLVRAKENLHFGGVRRSQGEVFEIEQPYCLQPQDPFYPVKVVDYELRTRRPIYAPITEDRHQLNRRGGPAEADLEK